MFKIIGKAKKNFRVRLSDKSVTLPILNIDESIKDDSDLWHSFQANIACMFADSVYWHRKNNKKQYLSKEDIWRLSNEAAYNFLKLWTT